MSLRARFALASVLATALVVILAGTALLTLVERDERTALDQRLAQVASASIRPAVLTASLGESRIVREGGPLHLGVAVRLLAEGRVIAASEGFPALEPPDAGTRRDPGGFATVRSSEAEWRVFSERVHAFGPGQRDVVVQVAAPTDAIDSTLRALRQRIAVVGLVAIAGAGAGSWWLGALILRPLGRIRQEADRVSETNDLRVRVPVDQGPPEVDELAVTFNRMLERIGEETARTEAALEASRAFASNAAHELRTPLTSMQTNLDVLEQNADLPPAERAAIVRDIAEQQRRLLASLEALRLLARGDLRRDDVFEPLDLTEIVDAGVERARREHPDVEVRLAVDGGAFPVRGWREGLASLLENLLRNAATHGDGPAAGVGVQLQRAGGSARLQVVDQGPGIPPEERDQVLERFTRGRAARGPGSGLGLALCAQQAALHGGSLVLEETPGGGTTVTVTLPLSEA